MKLLTQTHIRHAQREDYTFSYNVPIERYTLYIVRHTYFGDPGCVFSLGFIMQAPDRILDGYTHLSRSSATYIECSTRHSIARINHTLGWCWIRVNTEQDRPFHVQILNFTYNMYVNMVPNIRIHIFELTNWRIDDRQALKVSDWQTCTRRQIIWFVIHNFFELAHRFFSSVMCNLSPKIYLWSLKHGD